MQRVCTKCNTLVTSDGAFCPSCGEPLPAAVQLQKTPQSTPAGASQQDVMPGGYSAPNYGQPAQQANSGQQNSYRVPQPAQTNSYGSSNAHQFNNNVQPVNETPMTMGQWVGTIILTTWFGIISLILCIVWGVSSDTPVTKKHYCQAMIVIQAIGFAVGIIFAIVFAVSMVNIGSNMAGSYYYY